MIVESCEGAKEHCCLLCLRFVELFFSGCYLRFKRAGLNIFLMVLWVL